MCETHGADGVMPTGAAGSAQEACMYVSEARRPEHARIGTLSRLQRPLRINLGAAGGLFPRQRRLATMKLAIDALVLEMPEGTHND